MELKGHVHKVQYYETDMMGITHHSNYIRWMEEARGQFLDEIGWNYKKFEDEGIVSPVISLSVNYKHPTRYEDEVFIKVNVIEFKGVKLKVGYVMKNAEGIVVCEAESTHCFVDKKGVPVRMKKLYPAFCELLSDMANEDV